MLEGRCPASIQPYLFGGRLLALSKKDGGVRPIAVGAVWRRLAAKCANVYAVGRCKDLLEPRQLGVAVEGGAEAAIHAARRFVLSMPADHIFVKLDFTNAFNSLRRDAMLETVAEDVPEVYNFCRLAYANPSLLAFGDRTISSEMGPQQGDPLGPLVFSLAIRKMLNSLKADLVLGYLDDISLGGSIDLVQDALMVLISTCNALGLSLNRTKCEVIQGRGVSDLPQCFNDFKKLSIEEATLLGSALVVGTAMDDGLEKKLQDLKRAVQRFELITSHDALLILKGSLGASRLLYNLRTSPCSDHPTLAVFDLVTRRALAAITNTELDDISWVQASLPVRNGGLGIRSVELLAPSAFLASAASTLLLQTAILPPNFSDRDEYVLTTQAVWMARHPLSPIPVEGIAKQRTWDEASVRAGLEVLSSACSDPHSKARLLACQAPHSGDWLHAWPITACGLRLDNESIRVAVGLRLGTNLCAPHACPCGKAVDARGTHGLSCKRSQGRATRHSLLNDLVARAMIRSKIPCTKEPVGLSRSDGKRPDGVTLVPWRSGRCLAWDVTVPDTLAHSYLNLTSKESGAASECIDSRKRLKYDSISRTHDFVVVACETMGPINESGLEFLKTLGRLMTSVTGDKREGAFLLQRLSVLIQRCNAIAFAGSFCNSEIGDGESG
jgi:hypothetical protein